MFKVAIQPANPHVFEEIETLVESIKQKNKSPYDKDVTYNHKDRVINSCNILFESLITPKLEGELRELDNDDEFRNRFVNVVGHVQQLPNGNVFLSPHIIEPAEMEDWDPVE